MEIVLRPSMIFPIGLTIIFLLILSQVYKDFSNCILAGFSADAIVIETKKGLYLLSFKNLSEVFKEISKHTTEEKQYEWSGI